MALRIATWNINSVRIRLQNLERLAKAGAPDIICLQETKVENGLFPLESIRKLGYEHIYHHGQKSYNGVAFLSRQPLHEIRTECFGGSQDCRHIAAYLDDGTELHNFYVPAGGDIPDPKLNDKFDFKLRFMDHLVEWADQQKNKRLIMVGDMNIAPLQNDVWSHKQLLTVVSHTPQEVERMERLRSTLSWVDTVRHLTPEPERVYSWWSYRNRDWKKSDRGRRLDHIWITPALLPQLKSTSILKEARDWEQPSDHVPVIAEFDLKAAA